MPITNNQFKKPTGFTLLEVMVAMVIFSIGLLGLAGIQAVALKNNNSAYTRTVSMQLAYNMSDVLRASTDSTGNIINTFDAVTTAIPGAPTRCIQKFDDGTAPSCSETDLANFEIYHWKKRIEKELASGLGSISRSGDVVTIIIMWDDEYTGATGTACGTDSAVDLKCYTLEIQT